MKAAKSIFTNLSEIAKAIEALDLENSQGRMEITRKNVGSAVKIKEGNKVLKKYLIDDETRKEIFSIVGINDELNGYGFAIDTQKFSIKNIRRRRSGI